ncbi:MAG: YqgE/AlgH family protein [Chitinophagaceae bacterium]
MKAGTFIQSTAMLDDSFFEKAVIFITGYDEKGVTGFVINKIFPRRFSDLVEFRNDCPFPMYEGGPVDTENLFFLHQRPDLIEGGTPVGHGVYLGGDFRQAVSHMNSGSVTENDLRLFIGYCGWDLGQLESEIEEGSWLILENGTVFGNFSQQNI